LRPEVTCHSDGRESPEESAARVLAKLDELGYGQTAARDAD
jgi:hypothetical protein